VGKLNQVIAVVGPKKQRAAAVLTEAYHKIQKPPLFDGISRVYAPKDAEGEALPSEQKLIQLSVRGLIQEARTVLTEMFDAVATQDFANCEAKADVSVDSTVILSQVPVTHLLFLEKQLTDVETFVRNLPTLDPAESWTFNAASDCYATNPTQSVRTKKVPKAFVKYEATKEHPAQVDVFNEDVLVGYWTTVKFSGTIPVKERNEMLERVRALKEAVVKAREEANSREVSPVSVGKSIFDYVFGK